jgi:hypothetical protein
MHKFRRVGRSQILIYQSWSPISIPQNVGFRRGGDHPARLQIVLPYKWELTIISKMLIVGFQHIDLTRYLNYMSNLQRYKKDLDRLIHSGGLLMFKMEIDNIPDALRSYEKLLSIEQFADFKKELSQCIFKNDYQSWYSESLVIIKMLLPDRLDDFIKMYKKPKTRKSITCENYVIEDYLQGLQVTHNITKDVIVGPDSAIPYFRQQIEILKSAKSRFQSSLYDIKQLLHAELFDSELEAAAEINKKGFARGAGAIAGVVLERHLAQVCANHNIMITKKNPGINDFNQPLKDTDIIEVKDWRFIQHLADIRNLCDHDKRRDPRKEEIEELILGVDKIIKSIF